MGCSCGSDNGNEDYLKAVPKRRTGMLIYIRKDRNITKFSAIYPTFFSS